MISDEQLQRFHQRFKQEAVPWLRRRTVAINRLATGGNPAPEATGVLLQVADRHFVITAAHALDSWGKASLVIPIGENRGIDLTFSFAERTRDRDDADFALVPLSPEMVEALRAGYEFVRLADADPAGGEPAKGIYAVFGYPVELADHKDGLTSEAIFYPSNLIKLSGHDPDLSIALEIHPEIVDDDGDRVRLPSLRGISGCGIWRLHLKGDLIDDWAIDRIRLVGIEHTVKTGKWIRGVRVRHILAGLAARFPDLEPCVALTGIKLAKRPPAETS